MVSQYEAAILSSEQAITRARNSIDLPQTARLAGIWLAGAAAFAFVALEPPRQTTPAQVANEDPSVHIVANDATPASTTAVSVLQSADGVRSEFFLGYVEFDWDPGAPGGVPGFGPMSTDVTSVRKDPSPPITPASRPGEQLGESAVDGLALRQ